MCGFQLTPHRTTYSILKAANNITHPFCTIKYQSARSKAWIILTPWEGGLFRLSPHLLETCKQESKACCGASTLLVSRIRLWHWDSLLFEVISSIPTGITLFMAFFTEGGVRPGGLKTCLGTLISTEERLTLCLYILPSTLYLPNSSRQGLNLTLPIQKAFN